MHEIFDMNVDTAIRYSRTLLVDYFFPEVLSPPPSPPKIVAPRSC